ncbi:MAG: Csp1 family four helix bundle copper storage protein, partial [Mariprofundaceae bacterium]
ASSVFAGEGHSHHHGGSTNKAMTDAVNACVQTGHECIAHCIELIKSGDSSIIDCMKSVQETVAFCSGHAYISASNSKYLNDMCELGIKICGDCQKECEKHAKKHAQCKACAEACAACVKECKKHLKV